MKVRHLFLAIIGVIFVFGAAAYVVTKTDEIKPYKEIDVTIPEVSPAAVIVAPKLDIAAISSTTQPVRMFFAGDVMLDRNVRQKIDANGFNSIFSDVQKMLTGTDIAVANLEGSFTENKSLTAGVKNAPFAFTFDPSLAPLLKQTGFTLLGLANNHSDNFGMTGLVSTRDYITKAGLRYYGDPQNDSQISTVVTVRGIKVGFVGFHEFSEKNLNKVLAEITRLRPQVDFLVVSPHWGVEYAEKASSYQEKVGHAFIDRGADAVIGAHPHVVQPIEMYKGKPIFYSLGNFIFDQNFSFETTHGLTLEVDLIPQNVDGTWKLSPKFSLEPVFIDHSRPTLELPDLRQTTLANLSKISSASTNVKAGVAKGSF